MQTAEAAKHSILVKIATSTCIFVLWSCTACFHVVALQVGLLDIDICGPSVPKMLGLEGQEVHQSAVGWSPVYVEDNLAVMSIGKLLH